MRHSKCLQFYIKEYYSEILLQMQFFLPLPSLLLSLLSVYFISCKMFQNVAPPQVL